MKKYKKELTEDFIKDTLKESSNFKKTSKEFDKQMINMFESYHKTHVSMKLSLFGKIKKSTGNILSFKLIPVLTYMVPLSILIISAFFLKVNVLDRSDKSSYFNVACKGATYVVNNDIEINELIQTGKSSSCMISKEDLFSINLQENSEISFKYFSKKNNTTKLNLNSGLILVHVNKNAKSTFIVETDNSRISVIGTKFAVERSSSKKTAVTVKEGKVRVETKGFPKRSIYLTNGESAVVSRNSIQTILLKENIKDLLDSSDTFDIDEYKNKVKIKNKSLIYKNENSFDNTKNRISGFIELSKSVLAYSEISVMSFTYEGKLNWKKEFGNKNGVFIMSSPVFYNDRIYISSINKQIIVLDANTGDQIDTIITNGNISFGYSPVKLKEDLLFPLTTGIFKLSQESSLSLFIPVKNSTTPAVGNNNIYISSFVTNKLGCFNVDGKEVWSYSLNSNSFTPPVLINNYLYIIDNLRYIYKFDNKGNLLIKKRLGFTTFGKLVPSKDSLFIVDSTGYAHKISQDNLEISGIGKIDISSDKEVHLLRTPTVIKNTVILGRDRGSIDLYDLKKKTVADSIRVSNSAISTSVLFSKEKFFAGTIDGEIYILE